MHIPNPEVERKALVAEYRNLLRALKPNLLSKADREGVRQAFVMAMDAHKGMRRKSGELYLFHPMAVAQICARDIGLGPTAIICALLHDVVEDTEITLEDIETKFGPKVANIIDGLTKVSGVVDKSPSIQAENFRKVLLTLADDVRVILIKMADRLHNMRTLESMAPTSQLKIASETMVLYAPLAHRLGLGAIKTELEDLCLKYTDPVGYKEIIAKLKETKAQRNRFIKRFIAKLEMRLEELGIPYEIKGRPKSLYSIYNKLKKQKIPFEEVYDLFAIRIILDSKGETEKADCWRAYSIVTDFYTPNPGRLRDWVSVPKSNGYESLHTTVMGPLGRWVEVQIRTRRMDELAEKGYAAHYKYKDGSVESHLDEWLNGVRELMDSADTNAIDFLDDFKLNLFSDEVYVFTPKGEMITLPTGSTALDFAFAIHSQVGEKCLGAKVNHKLVPLIYKLKNGDQIEVITSKRQKPTEDWLGYVITAKAKSHIKTALKEDHRLLALEGKDILIRKCKDYGLGYTPDNLYQLAHILRLPSSADMMFELGSGKLERMELNAAMKSLVALKALPGQNGQKPRKLSIGKEQAEKPKGMEMVVIGETQDIAYSFARCCNPIPGDRVFGFVSVSEGVKVHRTNCPNGMALMSRYGYRIIPAKWANDSLRTVRTFSAGIRLTGIDGMGIVSQITDIISKELQVNISCITVNSTAGAFEGAIVLQVSNTEHLEALISKLQGIQGIQNVSRYEVEETLGTVVSSGKE